MRTELRRLAATLLAMASVSRAGNLDIAPATTHQKIEGFGGALAYYENWFTAAPNKSALYDTLFRGSGLSILRTNNWAYTSTSNLSHDSELVAEALERNPGIRVLTSSWSPPASLKANGSTKGDVPGLNTLAQQDGKFVYDRFGGWWKQSLQRMARAGIRPAWISVQNEPDINTDYESCRFDAVEGAAAGPIALANGGFESGLTGWGTEANNGSSSADMTVSVQTSDIREGSQAAQVVVSKGYGAGNNWFLQLVLPRWTVKPETRYQVAFWAKGTGNIQVGVSDAAKSYAYIGGFSTTLSGSWKLVTGEFATTTQSGTDVKVGLYLGAASGTFLFDDFRISQVSYAGIGPAVAAVADSVATLGASAPLVLGPEVLGVGFGNLEKYAKGIDPTKVAGWSFHLYHGGSFLDPASFIPTFKSVNSKLLPSKPMFMTEYYNQEKADTAVDFLRQAWIMQSAFTELSLSAWVHWDLAWGDGSSMVAVYNPWDRSKWPADAPQGFRVMRTYHALAQYARFVKPGWSRVGAVAADTGLKSVAFRSAKGDSLAVVVVNPWASAVVAKPTVAGYATAKGEVWSTTPTVAIQKTGTWTSGQNLTIPARSVTTLVSVLSGTTGHSRAASVAASLRVRGRVVTFEGSSAPRLELLDAKGRSVLLHASPAGDGWVARIPASTASGIHVLRVAGAGLDRTIVVP